MGAIHNDRHLHSGRGCENGDQRESVIYVIRLLALRPSEPDHACDADLSLLAMRPGHPPRPQRGETDRTKGAGSPFGERARSRLRRTENLPGGRPGIPRHNAIAFGGGRMSTQTSVLAFSFVFASQPGPKYPGKIHCFNLTSRIPLAPLIRDGMERT